MRQIARWLRLRQFRGAQPFVGYGAQTAYDPLLRMALVPRVLEAGWTLRRYGEVAQRGDSKPAAYWTSFTATKWVMSPSATIGINTLPRTRFGTDYPVPQSDCPLRYVSSPAAM